MAVKTKMKVSLMKTIVSPLYLLATKIGVSYSANRRGGGREGRGRMVLLANKINLTKISLKCVAYS